MSVKLSVIVRTYNRPALLKRALSGILQQTLPVDELILVNNGGEPPSPTIWEDSPQASRRGLPLITCIDSPEPLSLGAAANLGLRSATGDWVAFHDDDDLWPMTYAAETLGALSQVDPQVALLGAPVEQVLEESMAFSEFQEIARFRLRPDLLPGTLPLDQVLSHNLIPPIALWYQRQALLNVGGYAEDIPVLEDWVANRALLLKHPGWLRSGTPVEYRVRSSKSQDSTKPEKRNTVTTRLDQHLQTRRSLLDRWLREELENGKFGPALYTLLLENQAKSMQAAFDQTLLQKILRKVRRKGP